MKGLITVFILVFMPVNAFPEPVIINAVGDIMLAGSGEKSYHKYGYDYPFVATGDLLRSGDLVIGNLEAPIAASGDEFTEKKFRFRVKPTAAAALKNAGFTHLSLANNHMMDFGSKGLKQTLELLDSYAISHSGAGADIASARKATLTTIKGVTIAVLSYSLTFPEEFYAGEEKAGTAPGYAPFFTADIEQARQSADCVIVSFHWGGEGLDKPKPYQVATAHKAVDAGADIVIGHHPHVLQGVELYGEGVIFYSLGNFTFGSLSNSASRSIIVRITFDGSIKSVEVIPLNVRNSEVHFQPKPLKGRHADKVTMEINSLSATMGSQIKNENGRYLVKKTVK